jgi:hypothetical protein
LSSPIKLGDIKRDLLDLSIKGYQESYGLVGSFNLRISRKQWTCWLLKLKDIMKAMDLLAPSIKGYQESDGLHSKILN